jgi:hypothetical protein
MGGQGIGNGDGFSCPCCAQSFGLRAVYNAEDADGGGPPGAMHWPGCISWSCKAAAEEAVSAAGQGLAAADQVSAAEEGY